MNDTYNFHGETQFIKEAKDNVSIVQNIYKDAPKLERKLDEMFDNINENQLSEINKLIDILFQKIDESKLKENQFSNEEIEEFKKAKYSSDTKAKIKWTYPLSGVIKELTGFSFELEKEWKRSKEIKPSGIISALRKIIPSHELQQTNFNQIETSDKIPKALKS
ncbi:MAG: hypothetical protein LUM44_15005 [Pyrinomonadaceae bacterium]|nr:hypothetical protein [Pyrinomonadaceae bacterium]